MAYKKDDKLHYFKASHPPRMYTAYFERPLGTQRAEIRIQVDPQTIVKRCVRLDQLEPWKVEREGNRIPDLSIPQFGRRY